MQKEEFEHLKEICLSELDAAGYFIQDYDAEIMKLNSPDWKPYSSKSFGEMLMDFAQYYNKSEENRDYVVLEKKLCPKWRHGAPEYKSPEYLLQFKYGGLVTSADYREFNNSFYYEDGDYYESVRADDKDVRWLYVSELNNLPND